MALSTFDIDAQRWDQSTFMGRLKHFFNITDCRTALLPDSKLDEAKALVESCRAGSVPPGTTEEQLHYAKKLYDSAFHPDTGDRMNLIGRMSFQVPGGMAITGFMLQFYSSCCGVLAVGEPVLQRSGQLHQPQRCVPHHSKKAPPLVARWVPFAAVAAANCVNIPMMRQQEILNGIAVTDENGNKLGHSNKAAVKGITQVVISRITMAAPGMIILPIIMERMEKYKFMQRITFLHGPIQVMMVGVFLVFMVPAACSLFPQRCSMAVSKLEPELRDSIISQYGDSIKQVYFNKGL
ncbi:sideroflexin-2 isoform X2 [Oryzias latipes]|uniref:sideroflexin-2 isoform X2 n=1 Tax=Oryzias latipes TaxID=8090 RepID=UPI000CE19A8D|nr:sideroflexin-2 isoform X2 [Oryzias latipes]